MGPRRRKEGSHLGKQLPTMQLLGELAFGAGQNAGAKRFGDCRNLFLANGATRNILIRR